MWRSQRCCPQKTIELYGERCTIRAVNNPVLEEDADNQRFLRDVEQWTGVKVEFATNPLYPNCSAQEVWEEKRYMSGLCWAPCLTKLKKEARQIWESHNHYDWLVLGFDATEKHRHDRFVLTERWNTLPILINAGLSKSDCWHILLDAGIRLPRLYEMGYPNANCIGCVRVSSPTYWNLVRVQHPDVFASRAQQSREIGARLVEYKGIRIFLDELSSDAVGGKLKTLDSVCGPFCEERQSSLFYGVEVSA